MLKKNKEFVAAFGVILFITSIYWVLISEMGAIPSAGDVIGHSIGIIGFTLMIATETLYSFRKRSRKAQWGKMSSWLSFHIFTGLVGPYLVLLHSSWKFNGIAGVLSLMTVVVVFSGFVGRYIYTSVPRNAEGIEVEASILENRIKLISKEMQTWATSQPKPLLDFILGIEKEMSLAAHKSSRLKIPLFNKLRLKMRLRHTFRLQKMKGNDLTAEIQNLLLRKFELRQQVANLSAARRLLSLWHTIHVPLGMGLFALALVHILGSIFYSYFLP